MVQAGREGIIIESEPVVGNHTSSRNSEVIHAGIYYPTGSLKAEVCVRGKHLLYEYCASHGVPHKNIQKLIVASDESEVPRLHALREKAADNGVGDLVYLDAKAVERLEPAVRSVGGLLSPSTGIIDSHGLMLAYQGDAEDEGAMIAFNAPVQGGRVMNDGIALEIGGEAPMHLHCRTLINSAGFSAQSVASSINGFPAEHIPPRHLAKGNYYSMTGAQPFSHLVYPMPAASVLGVHVTLDLSGRCRFGPDLEWIDEVDYEVDPRRADTFYEAVRTYFPDLEDDSLQPDYAGIRAKIHGPGEAQPDFVIQGPEVHGVAGMLNLFGIESPGLTASLAIAEMVQARLEKRS
jgi:L-2-hydroxyglutarate oxidase LhgO